MQAAVKEAFEQCGLSASEEDVEDFLDALFARGYVIVREIDAKELQE